MSDPLQEYRQQASYRRGTVMGLTAAEAFMLVAFILLTILVFWRVTANEERARLLEENANLTSAMDEISDPRAVANALALQERFSAISPDEMEARLALVKDDKMRALATAAQELPEDGLLELTDLSRNGAVPGAREKLDRLAEIEAQTDDVATIEYALFEARAEQRRLEEEMARRIGAQAALEAEAAKFEEMVSALAKDKATLEEQYSAFAETGLTPEEILSMEATLNELGAQQEGLARTGAQIAATIREEAGERIAELGGRILPDGDVIFPEAILFDANSADIRPDFDTLLQSFCRLWFETLYEQRESLDTVQVEGHASSEYGGLPSEQAFVRNLDLSQRRAAAVFGRCLAYGGDDEVTGWARSAMAAVGYSSSRAIIQDGLENRAGSRRVVFALEPKTESQMTKLVLQQDHGFEPTSEPEPGSAPVQGATTIPDPASPFGPDYYRIRGYEALSGQVTRIFDGDTIEVEAQPIRIQGLHAPEMGTEIGRQARRHVVEMLEDKRVTCWLNGEKTYDRKVGVCFLGERDVAASVIAASLGRDCPAFSGGRYARLEAQAASKIEDLPGYCL